MEEFNHRMKLRLDTDTDLVSFLCTAENTSKDIILRVINEDGTVCIDARSALGMRYIKTFKHLWLISNSDKIHSIFRAFSKD